MLTTLPALCLISLAYFLCEKNGVEQIVWPWGGGGGGGGGGGILFHDMSTLKCDHIVHC